MKKNAFSKILILAVSVIVFAALMSFSASADSGKCGDDLTWTLHGDGTLEISGSGAMWNYDLSFDNAYPSSTAPWSAESGYIKALKLNDGITSIGDFAFFQCTLLSGELIIPDGVERIGFMSFSGCNQITSVTLPKTITRIGDEAFGGCSSIREVTYNGGQAEWDNISVNDLSNYNLINAEIKFAYIDGKCGDDLTWTLHNDGTLEISGSGAMWDYDFEYSSTVGHNITTAPWGEYANELTALKINEGITYIGKAAFAFCLDLSGELIIPESVTTIGDHAFYNCSGFTGELIIPDSVTSIGDTAFYFCSNLSGNVEIGDNVNFIGDGAFASLSAITSINVSEANTKYSSLDGILYNKDKTILVAAPAGKTGELVIPDGVTTISVNAFIKCDGLTGDLVIPDSVKTIAYRAFYFCSGFTTVYISKNVSDIGDYAFFACFSLETVYYSGSEAEWNSINIAVGNDALLNAEIKFAYIVSGECGDNLTWKLYHDGLLEISGTGPMWDYDWTSSSTVGHNITTAPWGEYANELTALKINEGITSIGEYAFYDCSEFMGKLIIPNSVTTIGDYAFRGCNGFLGELVIPGSVTTIGESAFTNCMGFTGDLVIPDSVITIEDKAFSSCGFTGSLTIGNSVTSIGDSAFYACQGFTGSIHIGDSVTYIGEEAFCYCKFTGELVIPDSVTSIGDSAFYWCHFTGGLVIPGSIKTIGSAFRDCEFGGDLVISDGVKTIESFAFYGCRFKNITIPKSLNRINNNNFAGTSVGTVYYEGSEAEWNEMAIYSGNDALLNAEIVFETVPEPVIATAIISSSNDSIPTTLVFSDGSNTFTVIEDEDGGFNITAIPNGTYTVTASKLGHLSHTVTGVELSGESIDLGKISLISGDVSGDGFIDGVDVALLARKLLSIPEENDPNNLNGDGFIDALDVSILASNMFKTPTSSKFGE